MPSPTLQNYINAASIVYLEGGSAPTGLTLLHSSGIDAFDRRSDGFFAQAFRENSTGNIIIAYEGSRHDWDASVAADKEIAFGKTPQALLDAVAFAKQVYADFGSSPFGSPAIYVTGHSLGGVEAEKAAASLSFIVGSTTFGAPGLPGYVGPSADDILFRDITNPLKFINYVENGDPVGNYGRDSWVSFFPQAGSHVGSVKTLNGSASADLKWYDKTAYVALLVKWWGEDSHDTSTFHSLSYYATDLGYSIQTQAPFKIDIASYHNFTAEVALQVVAHASTAPAPTQSSPHPVITNPTNVPATINSSTPLNGIFSASEANAGSSGHHIDHYSAFVVRGTGSIIVNGQAHGLGSPISNITPAQFATAFFSAGASPGVTEIAVVAFDDLGNSSLAGDATVTVTAPTSAPQPIISSDHTAPTIVNTGQQLVTGVGSNPNLTSAYLQVADSNSANYTPSQLTYTITTAPSHGYLIRGGSIVSSFTQADINNRLIEYQEDGTVVASDSFSYFVSDPAGNRSSPATFNISINAPQASTHPVLDTNSPLSVGQAQAAVITASNLHVTDSGLNPWQIIYSITGGATHGQILAGGINVVSYFTQQQVDLGLISYRNTGNLSGPDNLTFTVSDSAGGAIGTTSFGINVIPQNNLHVSVNREIHNVASNGFTDGANNPVRASIISSDVLSAVDNGVSPANITYTIQSISDPDGFFLIGSWTAHDLSSFVGHSFGSADLNNKSHGFFYPASYFTFTQADVNAGRVFYETINGGTNGQQFPVGFSVADNAGNTVNNLVLETAILPGGMLSNGTFIPNGGIPQPVLSDGIGETAVIGKGLLTYISSQFADSQIVYTVWYTPGHGSLKLNGQALAKNNIFTQSDIDQGRLSYTEDGSIVLSDQFGLFVSDPNNPTSISMVVPVTVKMTGNNGGLVQVGDVSANMLNAGTGSNVFVGDGNTIVSYANSPNGVSVNLFQGKATNGYGGQDTLVSVHSIVGSTHDDSLIGNQSADSLAGGSGRDTLDGGLSAALNSSFGSWHDWTTGITASDKVVDLNGDHNADLLQFYNGRAVVALSNGSGFGTWRDWTTGVTAGDHAVDVNADGRADLVQFYNGRAVVALSSGSGFGGWQDWATGVTSNDHIIDLNGDGNADLVQFYQGRVVVALSTGSGFGGWRDWGSGVTDSDQIIDVNGDHKADLVQFYNGRAVVALSDGSSFGRWSDWASGITASDQIIDVNGDSRADVVQFYQGRAVVALSSGSGFGSWGDWGTGVSATDKAVDVNGDGRADLVQFYNSRAVVSLSTSNQAKQSTDGNDILTGGPGVDNFVFGSFFGHDHITDFQPGIDTVQIDLTMLANFNQLLAHTLDDGHGNTVVSSGDNTITLDGILKANLVSSDFHFI